MDQLTAEELILIGAFAPSVRTSTGLTLQLAVQELNAKGGLPGANTNRPVLVIECDGSMPSSALHHLVDELGVHAILASLDASALRTIVTQIDTREEAFFLSPGDSYVQREAPSSGGGHIWYLGSNYGDVVPAYSTLVDTIAAAIAQTQRKAGPITIAGVTSSRDEDTALNLAVYDRISRNMASSMLPNETRWLSFSLRDEANGSRRAMLEALVQSAPDIVMSFAGGVFGTPARQERSSLFRELEDIAATIGYAPRYILAASNVEDTSLARLARDSASFRFRALALRAGRSQDVALRAALDARFEAAFPEAAAFGFHVTPAVYDSLYYLAYAVAAVPDGLRGGQADLTQAGFANVTDGSGPEVAVGPDGLGTALEYLGSAVSFRLRGTDGPADFDVADQARPGQGKLYCWDEGGTPRELATHASGTGFVVLEPTPCEPEVADVVEASARAR